MPVTCSKKSYISATKSTSRIPPCARQMRASWREVDAVRGHGRLDRARVLFLVRRLRAASSTSQLQCTLSDVNYEDEPSPPRAITGHTFHYSCAYYLRLCRSQACWLQPPQC